MSLASQLASFLFSCSATTNSCSPPSHSFTTSPINTGLGMSTGGPQNWVPTVVLWFGWFGFNGGSAISANLHAVQACIVTNLAASVGGITWMLWDYRLERKWSAVGFCSGAISGLVAITPGSGFVGARKCLDQSFFQSIN